MLNFLLVFIPVCIMTVLFGMFMIDTNVEYRAKKPDRLRIMALERELFPEWFDRPKVIVKEVGPTFRDKMIGGSATHERCGAPRIPVQSDLNIGSTVDIKALQ